jgi:glyoxylate carboligase
VPSVWGSNMAKIADASALLVEFAETVNVPVIPTLMG